MDFIWERVENTEENGPMEQLVLVPGLIELDHMV